ncbi:von Willebrand factor type A domain-containing protein [Vitiosangium sp. GDMCC 1.1324]|uniref:VWA domain-containing protein n=1 Tax=Vitiosangium sp. (strain GDMCC 1.1324) TaxID=2138576 RepID=UPI001E2A3D89|nr:von Willebrand factor type A domain-containing protein [Vitiosangium sp. GDMCC 1.1324]
MKYVLRSTDTEEERFSTFSVDVDSASYTLACGYLERGALPDEQAVRVEEFVNSFDYGYQIEGGINRVILCSDGVANNGITSADGIFERVRAQAARGITLTIVGP